MIGLCLAAAGFAATLPLQAFTLAWTHSIEKIRWEEDYRIVDQRLELVEARIRGSGAGMEPPDGAVLKNGVWHYKPALPPLERLRLARSSYVEDYTLCWDDVCRPMADVAGSVEAVPVLALFPCKLH
ncbi:MAG: hypothetical protein JWQ21_2105 [Herminiimonas sp.]|nr:hypothetical protein [Herminiimonas sp.]